MSKSKQLEQFYYDVIWTDKSPVPPVFDEFDDKEKFILSKDKLFVLYKKGVPVWILKWMYNKQNRGVERQVLVSSAYKKSKSEALGLRLYLIKRSVCDFNELIRNVLKTSSKKDIK